MVDVHKHVITLMDPISAPARVVISWTVMITHVLVGNMLQQCMKLANCVIQILAL